MTIYERVTCARCGERTAMSTEQVADLRTKVPDFLPFILPNVCVRCMLNDPALKAEMEASLDAWTDRLVGRVRSALARPLEAIDWFVESLK
jgi:hypothetical protein